MVLEDLLIFTRDGEWGLEKPAEGHTLCAIVRGTDFADVRLGDISTLPRRWIRSDIAERKRLLPDDIVIETAGGTKDQETGRTVLITREVFEASELPLVCASFSRSLRCDPNKVFPPYLFWLLQDAYGRGLLSEYHVQHTGVARFQFTNFAKTFEFDLLGDLQQRALAFALAQLEDKVRLNRIDITTLEALARAVFKSWFVDFDPVRAKIDGRSPNLSPELAELFPASMDTGDLGDMPRGWRPSTIGAEVDVIGGSTPSTEVDDYWGDPHAWATPKDLASLSAPLLLGTERRLTDAGLAKVSSGLLPVDTVLLSSRAPIGYLAIAKVPVAINQGFAAMVCRRVLGPHYAYFWAGHAHEQILNRANGSTFLEISKGSFRGIDLVAPSAEVASAFERVARPCFDRIEISMRQSATLAELRDMLLPRFISGDMQVSDIENLVGNAL